MGSRVRASSLPPSKTRFNTGFLLFGKRQKFPVPHQIQILRQILVVAAAGIYNKNLRHNIKRNIIFFFSKEILADFIDCRPQFAGTPAFDAEKNSGFGVNLKNAAQIGIKTTDKFVVFGSQRPTFPFGNIFALINNQPIVQKVTTREIFNYFMNPFLRKAAILQKFIVGKSVAGPAENYSDFGNNHKGRRRS